VNRNVCVKIIIMENLSQNIRGYIQTDVFSGALTHRNIPPRYEFIAHCSPGQHPQRTSAFNATMVRDKWCIE